ncbi:Alpha/Beta hydrolase protein [Exophiala viscosa]|uniref:Alpha/Beta hydrolase protein n=1 Tax=Exophiala viscosa TaxID=2486360 RepID=A0AAN6DUJ2_9EURO|nr:Alpha/Beta hydrolase protein [Exophiala viscosa]
MSLDSDLTIAAHKFNPGASSDKAEKLLDQLRHVGKIGPTWWDVGAERYRQMRLNGETPTPKPTILPQGRDILIPSREAGRKIPCRLFYPSHSSRDGVKGVFLHFHGGGWVLMSEATSDPLLQFYADVSDCVALSVGYRLAPEHPFPAAPEDCFDVAEYIVEHGGREFGGSLRFIGGESAGAQMSVMTTFQLFRSRPTFSLPGGLVLNFGVYDLSLLPSAFTLKKPAMLDRDIMGQFHKAFLPARPPAECKDASVSPLYEQLEDFRMGNGDSRLPKALFICGTADPLLDDSVFMSVKWMMAGAEAILKIYEGAPHSFIAFSAETSDEARRAKADVKTFLSEQVNGR